MSHNGPCKNTSANSFPVGTGTLSSSASLASNHYIGLPVHINIQHVIIYHTKVYKMTWNITPCHITICLESEWERGKRKKTAEQEINARKSWNGMHLLRHSLTIRNPKRSHDLQNTLNVFFSYKHLKMNYHTRILHAKKFNIACMGALAKT
jgi:hypothetical protein